MVMLTEHEISQSADAIFHRLLRKATGGTDVISMAAPALSTEFVRSTHSTKATANEEGALATIIFPSPREIAQRLQAKHGSKTIFGYTSTRASDAYPAGYGERAAKALAREDTVYQLKGTFPSAALALAKLRARVEAREGDVDAVDRIFARVWGLSESSVKELPVLHVEGSESTRMSAMEDRAYHALSGHPAFNGGYRVDMATLAPDALGTNVPLNWPRIRTGLKAIAAAQNLADIEISELRSQLSNDQDVRMTMDMVRGSQPSYCRPFPWETLVDRLLAPQDIGSYRPSQRSADVGFAMSQTYRESFLDSIVVGDEYQIVTHVDAIASFVTETSNKALRRTVEVILANECDRAMIEDDLKDEFDELGESEMTMTFEVPKYKLTRSSLRVGTGREKIGDQSLPDVRSQGYGPLRVKLNEFRDAGITTPIDVPGALNMAVYLLMNRQSTAVAAYKLLALVKDPKTEGKGPIAARLRVRDLYSDPHIRRIGPQLFGEEFMGIFETLFKNVAVKATMTEAGIRDEIWHYLCHRCGKHDRCPLTGGWRDLISYLIDAEQGWTLYYWARISIGKLHYAMSNTIIAPIAAGEATDFITLMRKSVKEHALRWAAKYTAEHRLMVDELEDMAKERRAQKVLDNATESEVVTSYAKYVPPHQRMLADLDQVYDEDKILNRKKGYTSEQYQRMVTLQVKAKFFSQIEAVSFNRELTVGISDEQMRQTLIEFYQGRWYSLERRIKVALARGDVFSLAGWLLPVHPWGDFITTYPDTLEGVLEFVDSLDQRAWTVSPTALWEKLKISIKELWSDISREITEISTYIEENAECQMEEQIAASLERRVGIHINALAGLDPIVIPIAGYRQPSKLPERNVAVDQGDRSGVAHYGSSAFLAIPEDSHEEEDEYGVFGDLDDDFEFDPFILSGSQSIMMGEDVSMPIASGRYLTYNEIWSELDMEEAHDDAKRLAFGLPASMDLDSQHLDSSYGPLVIFEDRVKTSRMWAGRTSSMLMRLGKAQPSIFDDDM